MDAVVIWNIFEVVVLQGPEEVQEYFSGDFEGLDQVPFLRYNKYDQIMLLHYTTYDPVLLLQHVT